MQITASRRALSPRAEQTDDGWKMRMTGDGHYVVAPEKLQCHRRSRSFSDDHLIEVPG